MNVFNTTELYTLKMVKVVLIVNVIYLLLQ